MRAILGLLFFAITTAANPTFGAVCFQIGTSGDRLVLDVTSVTAETFFGVAGEFVSSTPALSTPTALTGGGRLRTDGTISLVVTTFFVERVTLCCERYVSGLTATLSPPGYSTGSAVVFESARNLGMGEKFTFGASRTDTLASVPCS
jgi:hypothetical protein